MREPAAGASREAIRSSRTGSVEEDESCDDDEFTDEAEEGFAAEPEIVGGQRKSLLHAVQLPFQEQSIRE